MFNGKNSSDSSSSTNTARSPRERKSCLKHALQQTKVLQEVINDSTINKLDEAINLVDNVTYETSIQEKELERDEKQVEPQLRINRELWNWA